MRESPPSPARYEARQRAIEAVRQLRVTEHGDVFDLIADLQAEIETLKGGTRRPQGGALQ